VCLNDRQRFDTAAIIATKAKNRPERGAGLIAIRMFGGLGNQLFHYAFGRALGTRLGVDLGLDWGDFRRGEERQPALHAFPLKVVRLKRTQVPFARRRRRWHWLGGDPLLLVSEKTFQFDPTFHDLPDGVYLEGCFQSERYFAEIADRIRSELAMPEPPDARTRSTVAKIRSTPTAVSLHVRRGDYVNHDGMGACSREYYDRAARHIAITTGETPTLFVFSDDIEWAVANLRLQYPTHFVTRGNTSHPQADLWLMSQCRHHIIANSTFSWWGAWLNPSRTKIVVAPAVWFAGWQMDESTLIPEGWARL
jgi:Glycosyl transferase family 11